MRNRQDRGMRIVANIILMFLSICVLVPFVLLIISSFTDNHVAEINGYSFIPQKWSMEAYTYILNDWAMIGKAYGITIFVTVVGTLLGLVLSSMLAYALSKKKLPGGRIIMFLIVFTLLFNGGLVPTYYVYANIVHIKDTIWALIVPQFLLNGFTVLLVRNYFITNIPESLIEAAKIDSAGEFRIYFRIVLPLSLPIMATVGLMSIIAYWNDWTNGLYYLSNSNLYGIQNIMNAINENVNFLANNAVSLGGSVAQIPLPSTTVRMAIAVVGILPILLIYPFLQKYFVKGITIGSVKE